MAPTQLAALAAGALLVAVHVFTPSFRFLSGTPRSIWLSLAGGVSVAYVFVHLLPELAEAQRAVNEAVPAGILGLAERHVYLVALAGLATFYGLERLAKTSRGENRGGQNSDATEAWVFWIHIASFAVYNVLIGYLLLHREEQGLKSLVFFATAMALHFVVTDFGLADHHKSRYLEAGRWILSAAVLLGLGLGYAAELSDLAIAVLIAFIAGGVILNVLKEELPDERQSRFWSFALGITAYATLLLAL